jgi:hypothetical protein
MANIREDKITIPEGSNAVSVDVADHSFVAILCNGRAVVTDGSGAANPRFLLPPGDYVVRTDGSLGQARPSKAALAGPSLRDLLQTAAASGTLRISAAAPRVHPVDRVGQLPADGKSAVTITVQCVDAEGKVVTGAADLLYLRSTGGTLRGDDGAATSRIQFKAGVASFLLVADAAPRFVTVTVFGASPALRAELPFEFVPPSESSGGAPPDTDPPRR